MARSKCGIWHLWDMAPVWHLFKPVCMAMDGNSHARVLAASTLTLIGSVTDTGGILCVDFSPDGTKIVSGADSGMIKVCTL